MAIGSDVVYARIHEFGGWTGRGGNTPIKASQYVTKAVDRHRKTIERLLQEFVHRMVMR
jgi:phage gpG-like protein